MALDLVGLSALASSSSLDNPATDVQSCRSRNKAGLYGRPLASGTRQPYGPFDRSSHTTCPACRVAGRRACCSHYTAGTADPAAQTASGNDLA